MNISLVLAVYNNLHLTKECYFNIRKIYPNVPLIISSGGSNDGTLEWLEEISINDDFLTFVHDTDKINFSENYNQAIKLVDTEKLVLIHNDMILSNNFLENINTYLTNNLILSYTTIEPPIFNNHNRPGKIILDCGTSFNDFNQNKFNDYILNNNSIKFNDGASFFMAVYKSVFDKIGYFDGISFNPFFCEDDDFLFRAHLKGYQLKTLNSFTYHFVSKTSRFGDDYRDFTKNIEINSNRNFIRKWGLSSYILNQTRYWLDEKLNYSSVSLGLTLINNKQIEILEPFFNKIKMEHYPSDYVENEQPKTNYDLRSKFTFTDNVDVMITINGNLDENDFDTIQKIRLSLPEYQKGLYKSGNLMIEIK
jgi:GT2 family glycosyltransferase